MSVGRRKVTVPEQDRWVFNRVAAAYPARPPYPHELLHRLSELAGSTGCVLDLGAGTGHLARPLAERGHRVHAVEPAAEMLSHIGGRNTLPIVCHNAAAEQIPVTRDSIDLALVADAIHFMDPEQVGAEINRTLRPRGKLAIIVVAFADTPFMNEVVRCMHSAAPRRQRETGNRVEQLIRCAGLAPQPVETFSSTIPVDDHGVLDIMRSISFIGPAMNEERWAAFSSDIGKAVRDHDAVWTRTLSLYTGE